MTQENIRILLAARPVGHPRESDFSIAHTPIPTPSDNQVLVQVHVLSLDPYMRGRMSDRPSYAAPVAIGEVMTGGAVGKVIESRHPDFRPGDFVEGMLGWQAYAMAEGSALRKIDPELAPISTALGVLGMPGMTAYFGLLEIGQPKAGETVVVSGAAGAVGTLVGQIAKIAGCRVVGIVRGADKAQYLRKLGFDAVVDYEAGLPSAQTLATACPDGVDVYFDNVGGELSDRVLQLINTRARIVVCGQSSLYNAETPPTGPRMLGLLIVKQARAEGFLAFQFAERWPQGMQQMSQWIREDKLHYREDIVRGLENAPKAFIEMLHGQHVGKRLVQIVP
ncbi:MAG TPA: NADP-dependent oxidoreductase [Oxalobacteraceae bacterium]|jgi:NADPH-dependent curcumin reductase CurA|nr:NADP-dependent oxidoreductase [Oxalobacteraceae bacterium]HCN89567.1 NADP-dependent oxidoreductase [Oxalobacteraceae bacterium]